MPDACGWGRTIHTTGPDEDEICNRQPTCVIVIDDLGKNVHLCQEHFDLITHELDQLHPQ